MTGIRTVTTLPVQMAGNPAAVVGYEQRLEQARMDRSHVTGAIAIFEAAGDRDTMGAYANIHLKVGGDLPSGVQTALAIWFVSLGIVSEEIFSRIPSPHCGLYM